MSATDFTYPTHHEHMAKAAQYVPTISEDSMTIILATLPAVAEHGGEIAKSFYRQMLSNHPELKNVFNMTHQRNGDQPRALADAVYAAAAHIKDLSSILPALERIAEKHRSLQIKPEQYPIVGENLLLGIKEVLGEAATDAVLAAWGEAYGAIADVLIRMEAELYRLADTQRGGWDGFKDFKVVRKEPENELITSFYLRPVDGAALPDQIAAASPWL